MHIIAIGGGDKTPAIQSAREYLDNQHVAIIPTACSTPTSYQNKVPKVAGFFADLGMPTEVLHEFGETPSPTRIAEVLGQASLIYTIGGNTPHLLQKLPEHGSDKAISDAIRSGKTHAGVSAGALLPFTLLHTCPAKQPAKEQWDYAFLPGLGNVRAALAVHVNQYDPTPEGHRPDNRREHFAKHLPTIDAAITGFAIENGAAIAIHGHTASLHRSQDNAAVHVVRAGGIQAVEDNEHLTELVQPALSSR